VVGKPDTTDITRCSDRKSVLIVEDNVQTRQRLAFIVDSSNQFELQGAAETVEEAKNSVNRHLPDILLTDLQLPDGNGIELISKVSATETKSLVLTVMGDEKSVIEALKAGALGYLLKDDDGDDILTSLTHLLAGQSPISPSIARYLLQHFSPPVTPEQSHLNIVKPLLTKRESEVLNLVAKGYSYVEISDVLTLSVHTVASHVKNIYKKLNVNSRGEAVFEASQLGILSSLP